MKIKTLGTLTLSILFSISPFSAAVFAQGTPPKSELIEVNENTKNQCVEFFAIDGKAYCSTKPLIENPAATKNTYDHLNVKFDQRTWAPAWGQKTSQFVTVEYITEGDDINNWKELITSQFVPSLNSPPTPPQYVANVMGVLKTQVPDIQMQYLINTPEEVIFEFKISKPAALTQHEIQRVFSRPDGLYVVHYVVKKPDMGIEAQKKWVDLLKQATPKQN